jgi:hypothetical protein
MRLLVALAFAVMLHCLGAVLGHAEERVAPVINQHADRLADPVTDARRTRERWPAHRRWFSGWESASTLTLPTSIQSGRPPILRVTLGCWCETPFRAARRSEDRGSGAMIKVIKGRAGAAVLACAASALAWLAATPAAAACLDLPSRFLIFAPANGPAV